jgi:predicted DNA binding CopG/RHH family protein
MEEQMKRTNIPQTDSIQELAHFWDIHDLTDFEDELEEVSEPVFERQTIVTVRLEPRDAEVVKALARSRGISHIDLIQEWVLERIHASAGSAA